MKVTCEGLVTGIAAGSGVIPAICPNAHAAVLCPSFYRTDLIHNPTYLDKTRARIRSWWIKVLSRGLERRAARFEPAP